MIEFYRVVDIVQITDRQGDIIDEIPMTNTSAPVIDMAWDKDGDVLAVLQEGNPVMPLWSLSSRRVLPLDTGMKDPTFLCWSKAGPQLAVGTAKGNLLIYHRGKKQKTPVMGKHARSIICGEWSRTGNKLILGSEDKSITVSNEVGDTLVHSEVKEVPQQLHFSPRLGTPPGPGSKQEEVVVSASINGKSLLLMNIVDEKEDPIELCFNQSNSRKNSNIKYGDIIKHEWINENTVLMGFSGGMLVVASTLANELGTEKLSIRADPNSLLHMSYNAQLGKVATAGSSGVQVFDIKTLSKTDNISSSEIENGYITDLQWSPDGQILTIATAAGNMYNFLVKMASLSAVSGTIVGYLSSLREMSVVDCSRRGRSVDVPLTLEPTVIAVGPRHVAAGMNNKVYFHRIGGGGALVLEQEYVGSVKKVMISGVYAAVLTDGKVTVHMIEGNQQQSRLFPGRDEAMFGKITCMALADDFMFYATETGSLEVFYLPEMTILPAAELRLERGIAKLFPNAMGTRVVVIDDSGLVYLYNPVTGGGGPNQSLIRFDMAPQSIQSVIWDVQESNVVILNDGKCLHTYVYAAVSMRGPVLTKLGPIEISTEGEISVKPDHVDFPSENQPLICINGTFTMMTPGGTLTTFLHPYFDQVHSGVVSGGEEWGRSAGAGQPPRRASDVSTLKLQFGQFICLLRLEEAWKIALQLDRRHYWFALANKAMEMLNIELATRVYRQLGDAAMVQALKDLAQIEDKNSLAGHASLLFGDYSRAQELFLSSSYPAAALNMQRDLLQWEQALKLALVIDIHQVPEISLKYALQLEVREDYTNALHTFEEAMRVQNSEGHNVCPESLIPACMAGIARCNLRLGNLRQGVRLAQDLGETALFIECGHILEQQKQFPDAATMHLKAQNYDRAAEIFTNYLIIADKTRIPEAAQILEKVKNMQLNSRFAKICASCGKFAEAAAAYERAQDWDKVVELRLRNLDQVQQAFDLVRQTTSAQGALLVAEYCQEVRDYRGAIEFLLMANKSEEAFKLAQSQGQVDSYANILGDHIGADDALKVAHHYEKAQDFAKAGKYFAMCGQYSRALKFYLQCGDRELDAAVEVVAKSQNENLVHQLVDFLMGEKDGVPKDPNYLYRLWMARKKYDEAVKTALSIVAQEQEHGSYQASHAVLYETIRRLEDDDVRVPLKLRSTFVIIHSYILAKILVRMGDTSGSARVLLRVTQSISSFPKDTVRILTSAVVLCQKAGLKASSYEIAKTLMHPEYRSSIDENLKRKIEAIVRRRAANNEDAPEDLSLCPVSNQLIPVSQLECPTTRDALPMCIITGRHMLLDDWCFCPVSRFPALYSEYIRYIETMSASGGDYAGTEPGTALDPILGKPVAVGDLTKASKEDAVAYIQKYNNVKDEASAATATAQEGGKSSSGKSSGNASP